MKFEPTINILDGSVDQLITSTQAWLIDMAMCGQDRRGPLCFEICI